MNLSGKVEEKWKENFKVRKSEKSIKAKWKKIGSLVGKVDKLLRKECFDLKKVLNNGSMSFEVLV